MIRRLQDEWSDNFARAARRRLLPGSQIGEVLAEVDAHCADSGQSRPEAFGDPVAYAETLAHGQDRAARNRRRLLPWTSGVKVLFTLAGILFVLDGIYAVRYGIRGSVTVGELV